MTGYNYSRHTLTLLRPPSCPPDTPSRQNSRLAWGRCKFSSDMLGNQETVVYYSPVMEVGMVDKELKD